MLTPDIVIGAPPELVIGLVPERFTPILALVGPASAVPVIRMGLDADDETVPIKLTPWLGVPAIDEPLPLMLIVPVVAGFVILPPAVSMKTP